MSLTVFSFIAFIHLLLPYTRNAVTILDSAYSVSSLGNIIFMAFATILIAYFGMIVTERFIVPRIP